MSYYDAHGMRGWAPPGPLHQPHHNLSHHQLSHQLGPQYRHHPHTYHHLAPHLGQASYAHHPDPSPPMLQAGWEQRSPLTQSGPPREESPSAFAHQLESIDRALDNLSKSSKPFTYGSRRTLASRGHYHGNARSSSVSSYGSDFRGGHHSHLQNFYAAQRHQPPRGPSDFESAIQVKRRMAAARERELRNFHLEQQFNRTVLSEVTGATGRNAGVLNPAHHLSEEARRDLISRQRTALYEGGVYVDETGATRAGAPGQSRSIPTPTSLRGQSPLAYEQDSMAQAEPAAAVASVAGSGGASTAAPASTADTKQATSTRPASRANSSSSPHSNTPSNPTVFETASSSQQPSRASQSSPGSSPPKFGPPGSAKPAQTSSVVVAPIGTRPGLTPTATAHVLASASPLASPLHQNPGGGEEGRAAASASQSNPSSAAAETPANVGGWNSRGAVWGSKPGIQSVWA